jgi:hypothetical protein
MACLLTEQEGSEWGSLISAACPASYLYLHLTCFGQSVRLEILQTPKRLRLGASLGFPLKRPSAESWARSCCLFLPYKAQSPKPETSKERTNKSLVTNSLISLSFFPFSLPFFLPVRFTGHGWGGRHGILIPRAC